MPRVLVKVMSSEWSAHFIGPYGQTRIGRCTAHDYFCSLKNGHCSATYLSAASRSTQANETFFLLAMSSSVRYSFAGKLIDARTELIAAYSRFIRS